MVQGKTELNSNGAGKAVIILSALTGTETLLHERNQVLWHCLETGRCLEGEQEERGGKAVDRVRKRAVSVGRHHPGSRNQR